MKKIIMLFFIFIAVLSIKNVYAQDNYKLTLEKQPGIYYARTGGNLPYKSSQFSIYKFGDIIAYCIEPSKNITTYDYIVKDGYIDLPYSEEIKEKIELIGYYGREYPGHDNVFYSMASQALIWELTSNQKVTFWTERYEQGSKIDISKEKKEIMNLVNNHKVLPDLPDEIDAYMQREVVLEDKNNILNDFEIVDNGGHNVYIEDNKLHIIPKKEDIKIIKLRKKHYDEYKTMIFVGKDNDTTQTIGRLRFSKDIIKEIKLNSKGSRIKINKVDENNKIIPIEGIKFKIKRLSDNSYICDNNDCIFETNKNGYFITKNFLYGDFEISEVEDQIINGYYWNDTKYLVSINENTKVLWDDTFGNYVSVDFLNYEVKGNLEIVKKGEEFKIIDNNIIYDKKNLDNIKFLLYDEKDNYIDTIITNKDGYAKYEGLKVGNYYLKEDNTLIEYQENKEKIFFTIKQTNQYDKIINISLEITNYLKKSNIKFYKKDNVTYEGIPNTIIELYNLNNELLLTKETDENGLINFYNLPYGSYYLQEKEANKVYQLTNEKIFFDVINNNELIEKEMLNEKIVVNVPKTSRNDDIVINTIGSILFIIGFGGLVYEKHKTY